MKLTQGSPPNVRFGGAIKRANFPWGISLIQRGKLIADFGKPFIA